MHVGHAVRHGQLLLQRTRHCLALPWPEQLQAAACLCHSTWQQGPVCLAQLCVTEGPTTELAWLQAQEWHHRWVLQELHLVTRLQDHLVCLARHHHHPIDSQPATAKPCCTAARAAAAAAGVWPCWKG
jgi:hypothetical protein